MVITLFAVGIAQALIPDNDLHGGEGAEWSGGVFDATGTTFYVTVQHNVSGNGVVLDITGWK